MVLAALLFAAMALLTKQVAKRLPGPEVALVRFLIGLVACILATLRFRLRANNWRGLFLRGALGGTAVLCYFLAIEHLPVGIATLLNYTAPVFTAIWAALFLGEKLAGGSIGALVVTTVGVALVIAGTAPPGSIGVGLWHLMGIASSILAGAAVATIREVRRTDGSWEIFASFCIVGALVTFPLAVASWQRPTPSEALLLALLGILAVVGQLLMTYSLRYLRAAVAGILMQLTPVAALVAGTLLLGERTVGLAAAGAAVTLLGVSWGAWLAASPAVQSEEP
jgi:drug/metabolite transporter (DMT)-like permease